MIVLDTHVWVWWVSGSKQLAQSASRAVDEAVESGEVYVSAISVWEVAMLVVKGRLQLTMAVSEWVARSEALPFVKFVPIDNALALMSVALEGFPYSDPADRLILATAMSLRAPVVTKDHRLRDFSGVPTIW